MSTINLSILNGSPALNLYTSLNEHLWFISRVWKQPFHPVIVEKCVYFSPALFLASFSLSLPLIAIYSTGPLVRSHSEKNQCCRKQEAWILHKAKAYYVSADNKSIFQFFHVCMCDLHTYYVPGDYRGVLCRCWMVVGLLVFCVFRIFCGALICILMMTVIISEILLNWTCSFTVYWCSLSVHVQCMFELILFLFMVWALEQTNIWSILYIQYWYTIIYYICRNACVRVLIYYYHFC